MQRKKNEPEKQSTAQTQFEFVLPVKITGIVFWGLVFVGLMLAVFFLNGQEERLQQQYQNNTILFIHDLKNAIQRNESESVMQRIIASELQSFQQRYLFNAFILKRGDKIYRYGQAQENDLAHQQNFHVDFDEGETHTKVREYQLQIFYPNLNDVVVNERKNILISIGALVFVFGIILQKILQQILNKPFLSLLHSAQQFARGNTQLRFDETSPDEFGFLSRFINQALNSVEQQSREVHRALARAKQSELALFKEKELAEVTLRSITDAVITTNSSAEINFMNPVAERILACSQDSARGKLVSQVLNVIDESTGYSIENPLILLLGKRPDPNENTDMALKLPDGSLISVELSVASMKNQENKVIGGVIVFQDVSEARHMTAQLSYQARHDELTGLYNRREFEDRLQALLEESKENNTEHVLCYLDLDQFKVVNDTCGHMAGDELLRQLSLELAGSIPETDLLARLGGDEFGILMANCKLSHAQAVADTIREQVKNYRFIWDARIFEIGVSIGVVSITHDCEKISDLMSQADLACYAAKDRGRNRIHVYQPTDQELAKRHYEMHCVTRINSALEDDAFIIFKQAIVPLDEADTTMHWEVLVRMENLQGDIVSPEDFIPAAERYNLMPRIDRIVIQKTFAAMSRGDFHISDYSSSVVGINLSGDSLMDDSFLGFIKQQAERYQINFSEVCLEITETVAIGNLHKATLFIEALKQLGCRFALDDFGSGLSSFGYLKQLPVDYLKIDGSFVKDMARDEIDRAMVESINQVGHIMKMKTIAEWVEDEVTYNDLKGLGVDYSQGYYTGKPEPLR
jgi:diguanylate cyclase (GGDEF)-like protein/PAS domain S-box-containing protein